MSTTVQDYIIAGLALVPVPLGQKGPATTGWNLRENAITSSQNVNQIQGNVGLAHAYCSPRPTCVLDIDHLEKATAWLVNKGIDVEALLGAPDAVQIISGKPGRAKLLFRVPNGQPLPQTWQLIEKQGAGEMILEFRCASKNGKTVQDLVPPSIHPDTGNPYRWGGNGHWSAIPDMPQPLWDVWQRALVVKKAAPLSPTDPADASDDTGPLSEAQVKDLRSALLYLRADDRALWVRMGMALSGTGEAGRGLWFEWSATSEKFNSADAARTWTSFNPKEIQLSYTAVFAEAQRQGWVNPAKGSTAYDDVPRHKPNEIDMTDAFNWPTPKKLPPALKPVPQLDPSILPEALRDWATDAAHRMQCPVEYFVMPALASAGAIVGNTIGIMPKRIDDSWIVHPVFWGAVVGPPGAMKTPSLNEAITPIRHLEGNAAARYKTEYTAYQQQMQQYKITQNTNRKAAQGVTTLPLPEPAAPVHERYMVHDTTYQKLGVILADNPRGVLALADELSGLLQSLDSQGQEAARGFFLQGWGGRGSYSFDRIERGNTTLTRFALSLFGGFQPDRIKAYVRFASTGSIGNDGLLQRFQLLVWPDQNPTWELVDTMPDKQAQGRMHKAMLHLDDLAKSPTIADAITDSQGVKLFRFSPDAQILFDQWMIVNERYLRKQTVSSALQSHFSKYRSLISGLALLFHLLDGHNGPVCSCCMDRAMQMALFLKKHAERIFSSVHGGDFASARVLARHLLDGHLEDGFTARSVYSKGWAGLSDITHASHAIETLVDYGWLVPMAQVDRRKGGRPTERYQINPAIHEDLL